MLARVDLRGCTDVRRALARPAITGDDVESAVAAIIAEVRSGGDGAVRALNSRFNGWAGAIGMPAGQLGAGPAARQSHAPPARLITYARQHALALRASPP